MHQQGQGTCALRVGVKMSIATTLKEGLVVGTRSTPGNPYNGYTLHETLEQAATLLDVDPEIVGVDRGRVFSSLGKKSQGKSGHFSFAGKLQNILREVFFRFQRHSILLSSGLNGGSSYRCSP